MDTPKQKSGKRERVVKGRKCVEYGVSKKEFHNLIKKASQPIKREAESDQEKSET